MILTDDNFATIVTAVEGGRGLYDNLMKYIRVQMIMLAGFILTFVGAGIFDIANGSPLLPMQILWINFAVDVLLALGLGFDAPSPGLMRRRPRSPMSRSSRRPWVPGWASPVCWWPSARSSSWRGPRTVTGWPSPPPWAWSPCRCCTSPPPRVARSVSQRLQPQHDRQRTLQPLGARCTGPHAAGDDHPAPPAHPRHRRPQRRPVAGLSDRGGRATSSWPRSASSSCAASPTPRRDALPVAAPGLIVTTFDQARARWRCSGNEQEEAARPGRGRGCAQAAGEDEAQAVRGGAAQAARRAGRHAGVGQGDRGQDLHRLRRTRQRGQGRHDQGHHRTCEPARLPSCCATVPDRAGEVADVRAALHAPSARRRRGRDLRPQLVQPGRGRAGDGFLHRRTDRQFLDLAPGVEKAMVDSGITL